MDDLDSDLRDAVDFFWTKRTGQSSRQGMSRGARDIGNRAAVTGGKQMHGFAQLIRAVLVENGVDSTCIKIEQKEVSGELPGF